MQTQTITITTLKDGLNLIASPKHRNDNEPLETRTIANFETGDFDGKSFSFSYKYGRFSGFCDDRGVMMVNDTTNEICLRKDVADAEYFAGLWFNEIDNGVTPAMSPARLKKQRASQPLQPAPKIERFDKCVDCGREYGANDVTEICERGSRECSEFEEKN